MKTTVGTKVDDALIARIKRVAEVDRRTVSNVVELCILRGLPALEEDLERRDLIQRTSDPLSSGRPSSEPSSDTIVRDNISSRRTRGTPKRAA